MIRNFRYLCGMEVAETHNRNDERELFYQKLQLPKGFEAKRFNGMNRVHFKRNMIGFAVMDMNAKTYNIATRARIFNAIGIHDYEYTENLEPNHAIIRNIEFSDTEILCKLINFVNELKGLEDYIKN